LTSGITGGAPVDAGEPQLLQGNEACAEGALAAGLAFFAGYPITPSSEIAELLARRLPQVGGTFIQMEDEIASMAAVVGASLAGRRSMTATSGPGFSLKQENLGYAAIAEVPCVVVNVQRVGPSTGMPTSPGQGDVMQARWGTHGDHPVVVLSPGSVYEAFHVTVRAFQISERLRVPVVVLMDEVVAHMREPIRLPAPGQVRVEPRPTPQCPPEKFVPYRPPETDDVPPMASFGDGYGVHVTGLYHDETGFPSNDEAVCAALIRRLCGKVERRREELAAFEQRGVDDAEVVVVGYGSVGRSAQSAVRAASESGIKVGLLRLITVWPFPEHVVRELAGRVRAFVVPEMNLGQLSREVERAAAGRAGVFSLAGVGGALPSPDAIVRRIEEVC